MFHRAREEFYIQNPQSRIDELLFQEATAKISAPNSKYNCSIDQKFEVRFLSFYMENQKAVNLLIFLEKSDSSISGSYFEFKLIEI